MPAALAGHALRRAAEKVYYVLLFGGMILVRGWRAQIARRSFDVF